MSHFLNQITFVLKTSQTKCVACIFVSFMSSYMLFLRSFKFHCFRTLISTQLIVIRCCHTVLNIIFNYLLRGVARPLFSMYIYILCILLICIVKDKLKPVRSDLLQVVIFPDLDHKRKYYRRRRIAKLIGEKPQIRSLELQRRRMVVKTSMMLLLSSL